LDPHRFRLDAAREVVVRGGGALLFTGGTTSPRRGALHGFSTQGTFVIEQQRRHAGISSEKRLPGAFVSHDRATDTGLRRGAGWSDPNHIRYLLPAEPHTGYLYQTSLDIQHELGRGTLLDIGFLVPSGTI